MMERRRFKNSVVYLVVRNPQSDKVIYQTHASRKMTCYEMTIEEWDALEILPGEYGVTSYSEQPRAYVFEMSTSKGMEYWCALEKEGRMITLFVHEFRNRAEFEAAELNWVFNGGKEPFVIDYPDPE